MTKSHWVSEGRVRARLQVEPRRRTQISEVDTRPTLGFKSCNETQINKDGPLSCRSSCLLCVFQPPAATLPLTSSLRGPGRIPRISGEEAAAAAPSQGEDENKVSGSGGAPPRLIPPLTQRPCCFLRCDRRCVCAFQTIRQRA